MQALLVVHILDELADVGLGLSKGAVLLELDFVQFYGRG